MSATQWFLILAQVFFREYAKKFGLVKSSSDPWQQQQQQQKLSFPLDVWMRYLLPLNSACFPIKLPTPKIKNALKLAGLTMVNELLIELS